MSRRRTRLLVAFSSLPAFISFLGCAKPDSSARARAVEVAGPSVSTVIDLSDWGLHDASELGFASVGILKERSTERMVIYDLRNQPLQLRDPPGARGRKPMLKDGLALIDHFEYGNENRLGGMFNAFARAPSRGTTSIDSGGDGHNALVFAYTKYEQGFCGFWIHLFDSKAPPIDRYYLDASELSFLTFMIRGDAGGESVVLHVADRSWEKKEDSIPLGSIAGWLPSGRIEKTWQQAWIPLTNLPAKVDRRELASLVFQIETPGQGQILLRNVAFASARDLALPPPSRIASRPPARRKAIWLWETAAMLGTDAAQNELVTFCRERRITDVFLQIPYTVKRQGDQWQVDWNRTQMEALVRRLDQSGLKVHALDGAPDHALEENHGRTLALLTSVIAYNRTAPPGSRFHGVRFDIEPYLLPAFGGVHKQSVILQYLALLGKVKPLANEAKLELGVDIPFWFDERNDAFELPTVVLGRPLTLPILELVDNVGVMDYRTFAYGADGVITHVQSELEAAARAGKQVFVGLETTALPDETIYGFSRRVHHGGSELRVIPDGGSRVRLVWSATPGAAGGSEDVLFTTSSIFVPASKITFQDDAPVDMERVMEQAERELGRWPSFAGFAVHSYESYRPWLERRR